MIRKQIKDPRQGKAGRLGEWLANPKNREKMYRSDKEDAAELAQITADARKKHITVWKR